MDKRQKEIILGQAYNLAVESTKQYPFGAEQHILRLQYFKVYALELKAAQEAGLDRVQASADDLIDAYRQAD